MPPFNKKVRIYGKTSGHKPGTKEIQTEDVLLQEDVPCRIQDYRRDYPDQKTTPAGKFGFVDEYMITPCGNIPKGAIIEDMKTGRKWEVIAFPTDESGKGKIFTVLLRRKQV